MHCSTLYDLPGRPPGKAYRRVFIMSPKSCHLSTLPELEVCQQCLELVYSTDKNSLPDSGPRRRSEVVRSFCCLQLNQAHVFLS